MQDCLDACRASDAGAALACAQTVPAGCDDEGVSLRSTCESSISETCRTTCGGQRESCETGCPRDGGCDDCAKGCALDAARCLAACG